MGIFTGMNKLILICGVFASFTGCISNEPNWEPPVRDWHTPLICPKGQIEYCEGTSPETLECQCIEHERMRRIYDQIMRRNIAWAS